MRGLALATLFLGLCFLDTGNKLKDDFGRALVFVAALTAIWFGL
jgi:hypothetical protein